MPARVQSEIHVRPELGHHQLPQEMAVLLVEAQQHAAIALVARIARPLVVRPDEHPALGHDRRRPGLAAERHRPFHIPARGRVEAVHQSGLSRDHVARECLAPLGLVAGTGGRAARRHDAEDECLVSTKHEIPKSETNSKSSKSQMTETLAPALARVWDFGFWSFEFVSDFEFRISNFMMSPAFLCPLLTRE